MLTDGTITLTTFRLDDAPVLMAIDRDPDCARWFDFPEMTLDERAHRRHAEDVIRRWESEARHGTSYHFAIRLGVDDAAIGMVALRPIRATTGALSYAVVADHRGRGLATRAAKLLLAHGREHLGFSRFELRTDVDNTASMRVAERAGFRLVRRDPRAHEFERHAPFIGQARDEYVYELDTQSLQTDG